jgi:hypothetical protein
MRYQAFGLTVESEFALPAIETAAGGAPDVRVFESDVPASLDGALDVLPRYQTAPDRLLLDIPGVARYLVQHGREIAVQIAPGASRESVLPFLTGSSFAAILQQRGDLVLHASSVRVGESAVAFAGPSGTGKSTLAAALARRGCDVLADDLTAVRWEQGIAVVRAGFRRLNLAHDSASMLGFNDRGPWPAAADVKLPIAQPPLASAVAAPLRRVYVLGGPRLPSPSWLLPIAPVDGLPLLRHRTFRYRFLQGFGRLDAHFRQCVALLRAVELHRITPADDLAHLPMLIDLLEGHWRDLAAPGGAAVAAGGAL